MANRQYIEIFGSWTSASDYSEDNQWNWYDVGTNHNVPASAVAEIVVRTTDQVGGQEGGVRATSGTLDRRVSISEAEGGGSQGITMHVQVDSSGWIQYYCDRYNEVLFDIVGYWMGCEYNERFDEFNAPTEGSWSSYALDQYNVGSGQIAEIGMVNINWGSGLLGGVRPSGNSTDRTFRLKESEITDGPDHLPGYEDYAAFLSLWTATSGNTAAIDVYSESSGDLSFILLGYFSAPPGSFSGTNIDFGPPSIDMTWETFDAGASGIPSQSVCQILLGQNFASSEEELGVRQTSSSLDRVVNVAESETDGTTPGPTWFGFHTIIDSNGETEYYAQDVSDNPDFVVAGYWYDFLEAPYPYAANDSIDLFIFGLNPYIHYIESWSAELFASSPGVWEDKTLSYNDCPPSTPSRPIVAEIIITNDTTNLPYSGGVRSTSSSIDRILFLHDALFGGFEAISMLVPVDSDGKIQVYAENESKVSFIVAGYWTGATYEDVLESFTISTDSSWENYNLGTDYADTVVEMVISTVSGSVKTTAGVREVGSSLNRYHDICKASGFSDAAQDHVTMTVNTSGANGTIQVYAEESDNIVYRIIGIWTYTPGTYHESVAEIGDVTGNGVWETIDFTGGGGQGSVSEIVLENRRHNADRYMGVREEGSSTDRYINLRETTLAAADLGADMVRINTNMTLANSGQLYHSFQPAEHAFRIIGYWDSFKAFATTESGQVSLFMSGSVGSHTGEIDLSIVGHESYNVLDEPDYPSGVTLYLFVPLIKSGTVDLFILPPILESGSSDLFLKTIEPWSSGVDLWMEAHEPFNSSGSHPSGLPLILPEGHESTSLSGTLYMVGPLPMSGSADLYIGAGAFKPPIDLYIYGRDIHSGSTCFRS